MDSPTIKCRQLDYFSSSNEHLKYVPKAEIITGIIILNNTLLDILKKAKDGAEILVTGPTASMILNIFFENGVTIMAGVLVTKPDELLDVISKGGSDYHFFEKSAERIIIRKK